MHVLAHALWQQRCLEVAPRLHHVGVVDETRRTYRHHGRQRDAPRRTTFRHATPRVAPHRYATLEPLGKPGGSRAFSADGPPPSACGSERVMSPQVEQMSHPKRPRGPLWCLRHNTAPFSQQGRAVAANSTFRWSHFAYAISWRTSSSVCASLISDRHVFVQLARCGKN